MDRQISSDIDVENCQDMALNSMLVQTQVKPGAKRAINDREEMVMRKKLRNRESAQRARDRQKAKMRWLEEELQKIKAQNEQVLRENLLLKHMLQETQSKNIPPTPAPQPQVNNSQLALQLQQQQRLNQLQIQRLQMQQKQTQQAVSSAVKIKQENSHDSDNSVPSVVSTGSNNIAMKGDDLLKFAANRTQIVEPSHIVPSFTPQQQYAAALAALAQNQMQPINNLFVGQQPPQPVIVDGKQRPSSVGGSNPSNCNTSDDDKAH